MNAKRVAIVTGSTGGIGEGIARRLANDGLAVIVSGRRTGEGERVVQEIRAAGGEVLYVRADITSETDCAHLIRAAVACFGRLDVLVNNAAIFPVTPIQEMTAAQWDAEFAIDVRGAFFCSREAIPYMRERGGGAIVNIGSTVVYRSQDMDRLAYACAKSALLTMTKVMARALLCDQIRVNWVAVGWVATPGEVVLRDRVHGDGQAFLQELSAKAPLGRLESVEDIASAVSYLASDAASHVTGCELNVSGGLWI